MSKNVKDTFCPLRWTYPLVDFAKGEVRTCCRTSGERVTSQQIDELGTDIFLNTQYQKDRRLEMLKGVRHDACDSCWVIEDAGITSLRSSNPWVPTPWHIDGEKDNTSERLNADSVIMNLQTGEKTTPRETNAGSSFLRSENPYMLEVNLSNTCDLKCSYCSPYFSSKWDTDLELWSIGNGTKRHTKEYEDSIRHETRKEVDPRFEELFWKWFNEGPIRTLMRVGIIGGEPLINPALPGFLDRLIESYKKIPFEERPSSGYFLPDGRVREDHKPLIWFVTNLNCSSKIMDKFIGETLPKLTEHFHVEIHASLESVGKRIEYTRFGLNWEHYQNNVARLCALKLPNFNFGFQIALNSLSITTLTDFLKYAKSLHDQYERPIILKHNLVSIPESHHPAILTPEFAYYLEDALHFLKSVKDKMRPVDDEFGHWPAYYDYIKTIHESVRDQQGKDMKWRMGTLHDVRINFYKYFRKYDSIRGTNFMKTFPEYADFYQYCRKLYFESEAEKLG